MTTPPYASATRVFWIVDNGSSHRGQADLAGVEARLLPFFVDNYEQIDTPFEWKFTRAELNRILARCDLLTAA